VGAVKWHRALHTIAAQLLAGILSAFLVSALLPGPLRVSTVLEPSMSFVRGLFLELFLTAQLVFTILQMPSGPTKPAAIGLTLFVSELCSVYYTGGSLNPARSFGPAVVVGFTREHCIYWVGPLLGGALAAGAHKTLSVVRTSVGNVLEVEAK
jgi:aquaporin related protein